MKKIFLILMMLSVQISFAKSSDSDTTPQIDEVFDLFKNSNKLIRDNLYDAELSKTGYIKESGYNLIFVPKKMCATSSNNRANFAENLLEKYHCEKK